MVGPAKGSLSSVHLPTRKLQGCVVELLVTSFIKQRITKTKQSASAVYACVADMAWQAEMEWQQRAIVKRGEAAKAIFVT